MRGIIFIRPAVSWDQGPAACVYREPKGGGAMTEVQFTGLKGGTIALSTDILTALRPELRGSLCLVDEVGYDEARTRGNAMIDRPASSGVRWAAGSGVTLAGRLARDNGLLVAVPGGGHSISG